MSRIVLSIALAFALAASSVIPAVGSPASTAQSQAAQAASRAAQSKANVDAAVAEYAAAQARLDSLQAGLDANSARLDAALVRQQRLQRRLDSRASGMYRRGRFEFIEVLTASASFFQFASLWDALIRINRRDAQAIRELKQTRAQIEQSTTSLIARQLRASAELRRIAAVRARAEKQLGRDTAAYASYLRQVRSIQTAAAAASVDAASGTTGTKATRPSLPRPAPTRPVGSGSWDTAVASCYGMGSVGHHTASGKTISADSMIVAHKTLPFGTLVEFSYNGRRGIASVEDRGPYVAGRSFDLGPGIARVLGIEGVETVKWRVVSRR